MKIHEVEAQVGITRKNIRFYEEQGLLAPRRNSENGYREYGEAEVETLRRIKLLRKLGLPLEEIRRMQAGNQTVADGMRRHLVTLERERRNLERAKELCAALTDREERLESLEAGEILERMDQMEREGATFMDKQKGDMRRRRYIAPMVAAGVMILLMAALLWLMVWAFQTDPAGAPPMPLYILLVAVPAVIILGIILALIQRFHEIERGEEDEARRY